MHRLIRVHVSERVLCFYLLDIHTRYSIKPFLIHKSHWLVSSWLMPGCSYRGVTWQSKSTSRGSNLSWVLLGHFPPWISPLSHTRHTRGELWYTLPGNKKRHRAYPFTQSISIEDTCRGQIEIRILLLRSICRARGTGRGCRKGVWREVWNLYVGFFSLVSHITRPRQSPSGAIMF